MKFQTKLFTSIALAVVILLAACGPTYVQPVQPVAYQQQQFQPGYDPNHFLYDAMLATVVLNGVSGYYGPNRMFYPSVMVGGVGGYYDSNRVFHTSVSNKTTVINNYNTAKTQFQQKQATTQSAKPNYGATSGSIRRSSTPAPAATAKPNYGSSSGSVSRSTAPATSSRPSYSSGSSSGGMGRRR